MRGFDPGSGRSSSSVPPDAGAAADDATARWMHLMARWEVASKARTASAAALQALDGNAPERQALQSHCDAIAAEILDLKQQIDDMLGEAASLRRAPADGLVVGYLSIDSRGLSSEALPAPMKERAKAAKD